jgi:hypothetical protein
MGLFFKRKMYLKTMQDYSAKDWEAVARANGLDDFEAVWALDIGWFEEPNERRGGWSGVSRHEIELPDGRREGIFIKRQQNHTTRSWLHPVRGIQTFRREFRNLMLLQSFGVPTLDVLYFAERKSGADRRAILISRELAGYASLEDCISYWNRHGYPERAVWHETMERIAAVARRMHQHRMQQNSFYPKHVFIGELDGHMDIRLIDFEKAKRRWRSGSALLRDLDTLNRHSQGISTTDRLRFLLAYHEQCRVNTEVRKTWDKLVTLLRRKSRKL